MDEYLFLDNLGMTWRQSYKISREELDSTLEYWLIREAAIGHVTDLIGQFQRRD